MTLTVGGFEFTFGGAVDAIELGEAATRDHSDMKLVDFVVEFEERYMFVEVVRAVEDARRKGAAGEPGAGRIQALKSARLCDILARKYRDSMFFHSHGDRKPKRVEYSVLYAPAGIDEILVAVLEDELKRRIPLSHPVWQQDSAVSCSVMTAERWRKRYGRGSIQRSALY